MTGRLRALGLPLAKTGRTVAGLEASRSVKWRPACGGISVGHYLITAGTLATRVYDAATGAALFLSNNHVLAAVNRGVPGDPILQPGVYDGGKLPNDQLGVLERFVELRPPPETNLVDAALGRPLRDGDLSGEVLDIGVVVGWEDPAIGMTVAKSGRSTDYAEAMVQDVNASVKIYYDSEYYVFEDEALTSYLGAPGDSGSIVVNRASKRAVGLLFAGSESMTVLNKMSNVVKLLNIALPAEAPAPSLWWLLQSIGAAMPVAIPAIVVGGAEADKLHLWG